MDGFSVAHDVIHLVGDAEDFVVIGAHALGHYLVIDADHMAVPHMQFVYQEGQHG